MTNNNHWTCGVELELADWDTRRGWAGYGIDPEANIVNSNGIAADRSRKLYPFGGEINTMPTVSAEAQVNMVQKFLIRHATAKVNYRCGLHIHIRVPGLKDNLEKLKRVQEFVLQNPQLTGMVCPVQDVSTAGKTLDEIKGEKKRLTWVVQSSLFRVPVQRVEKQLLAETVEEFFAMEVPSDRHGKPLFHAQRRAAINLRQLMQTDTVEFRCFWPSRNSLEIHNAIEWSKHYLECALDNDVKSLEQLAKVKTYPKQKPYVHWMEQRWRDTTTSKTSKPLVEKNISSILSGIRDRYDGGSSPNYLLP